MKTQVCIIGAGPAGLLLGQLLRAAGIECMVIERQTSDHVAGRIRAGVLETTTVELMERLGLDQRMKAEGILHDGFCLATRKGPIRIDLCTLTGRRVMVYGQTELTRDLMTASEERGLEVIYAASNAALHDLDTDHPHVTLSLGERAVRIDCRFVVGCDGFHGISRPAAVAFGAQQFERVYSFGWLGVLADVAPCSDELIYANHERGFALASMRSPARSRYYIDVPLAERLEDWPDERIWDELSLRLGAQVSAAMTRGPALEKSIAPLRSYVCAPMRHGSLMLCGDAAHIVPPTGAKGLNLAASDVHYAAEALSGFFNSGDTKGIATYSDMALSRVWKAERFSWWMTKLLHRFPEDGPFERAMQDAEFDYIASSQAAQTALAENYVGLPL